jgi:hypothetical protein
MSNATPTIAMTATTHHGNDEELEGGGGGDTATLNEKVVA